MNGEGSLIGDERDLSKRVQRSRLSSQIADIIRNEILTGRLAPDEHVGQTQWAGRVGTSRMPVRDAISQLCAEGLLVQDENGSARVVRVDPASIRDGYELNAVVAKMAAKRAAERITESELEDLESINNSMREAYEKGDRESASRLNWQFHAAINRAARSPRLTAVLGILATTIPYAAFELLDSWPRDAFKAHEQILAKLRARDAEGAAEAVEVHIRKGSEMMLHDVERRLHPAGDKAKKTNAGDNTKTKKEKKR